jgi:hypothetical protein
MENIDFVAVLVRESTEDSEQVFVRFWSAFLESFGGFFQSLGCALCFFGLLAQLIEIRLFLECPPIDLVSTDFYAKPHRLGNGSQADLNRGLLRPR